VSPGLPVVFASVLAGCAVALLVPGRPGARLATLLRMRRRDCGAPRGAPSRASQPASLVGASLFGGLGAGLVVGGWTGLLAGTGAALGALLVLRRLEPRTVRRRRERLAADLPLVVDLLAACLVAGRPPTDALGAVAAAVGGPLADELDNVTARLRLGADPVNVWREVARRADAVGSLGRTMARSLESGAPMAEGLRHMAGDLRRHRHSAAEQEARRVGVRAAAPLGLCFLPAFVLVGVVPAVVSAFTSLGWG
jgi:Flp pilus assembly protein TadB